MIKSDKGISLVSLVITIAVMTIIASITINMSFDRFEANNINKMLNDLEFLRDKVSNYYLKYGVLPTVRNNENKPVIYSYKELEFESSANDNENYYIIDLEAMEGISLNYGKEGYENLNASDDVYIINEKSHNIYYARGIEWDGEKYYSITEDNELNDTIPPSKPEIKIIFGDKNEEGIYITAVEIEIIPGKDKISGIEKTTYSINGAAEEDISTLANNIVRISDNGSYNIKIRSYDRKGNISENIHSITIQIEEDNNNILPAEYQRLEYIESTGTQYIDTGYLPTENTKIIVEYAIPAGFTQGIYASVLGAQNNDNGTDSLCLYGYRTDYPTITARSGKDTIISSDIRYEYNTKYNVELSFNKLKIGNKEYTSNATMWSSIQKTIYLFTRNTLNYSLVQTSCTSSTKMYNCKIYDGSTLSRNFIPCYRKIDNVIGMYDLVEGKFYTNQGTGDFIAGPEVVE